MLTKKDEIILSLLKENCKMSTREMSDRTGVPITTIHNRMKKMEQDGIIRSYTTVLNQKKLGMTIQAFIQITVTYSTPAGKHVSQEDLAKRIYQMPEVEECYIMTGGTDILIKVSVKDVDELNNFVINKLRDTEGVQNTMTAIVLNDISYAVKKPPLAIIL